MRISGGILSTHRLWGGRQVGVLHSTLRATEVSQYVYCSLNGGIRQVLIERSIGAPDQRWFYERAMGSTCGVHVVTYGQFSKLYSINNIQITIFNFLKLYPCSPYLTIFGREIGSACDVHNAM